METKSMTDTVIEMLADVISADDKVSAISNTVRYALNAMAEDPYRPEVDYGYMDIEYTLVKLYAAAIHWPADIATKEDQEKRINNLTREARKTIIDLYAEFMELSGEVITVRFKQLARHPRDTKEVINFLIRCLQWLEKEPDTPEKQAIQANTDFVAMLSLLV